MPHQQKPFWQSQLGDFVVSHNAKFFVYEKLNIYSTLSRKVCNNLCIFIGYFYFVVLIAGISDFGFQVMKSIVMDTRDVC